MKMRIIMALLMMVLLSGCVSDNSQQEHPTESAKLETTVDAEAEVLDASATIQPLPDFTMEILDDATVNVSFEQENFYRDASGRIRMKMQVYSYEKFDLVDISMLKAGDSIFLAGEAITVNMVERNDNGTVLVNGGLDEGGFDLATDDSGIYYVQGYSDMKSWYLIGETEFPVSDDFVFTDSSDLDRGTVIYDAEDLFNGVPEHGYQPQNTNIRIENGRVVAMERIYTP